ncbi:protein FAM124A isoform X1 [Pangasianodon hypophthalmus]|uniref:protein FAM124A isoform X1 n=1 Tax=Pangasianodon hypophthalmus TaxID=310915 RepID=UPI0023079606|nr:protein FAM124A isoform X1 [Pangasianodon hypophthalmus]
MFCFPKICFQLYVHCFPLSPTLFHCPCPWDLSMGDLLQDPFLVSVHIITDPGEAKTLQSAADQLLSLLHPQLTLFRVSERAERPQLRPQCLTDLQLSLRPCLSVILFLQEGSGREESHEQQLRRPPWRYHHTEQVKDLSFSPVMQDFFILAPGTPLWALRQVHGKEIVRFTIYCRYETYNDQVRLYRLLLRRPLAQRNRLYSFCVVYSNHHMEIQLSFKRSPRGQDPTPTECTFMEIRVTNMGGLIPLLPYPCRPISDIRWQTKDYDGNKILLQVQGSSEQSRDTIPSSPSSETPSFPPSNGYGPDAYRKCHCQITSHSHTQNPLMQTSQTPLSLQCKQEDIESVQCSQEIVCAGWTDLHTHSLISMATEAFHSVSTYPSTSHPCSPFSLTMPRFRINVDTLVGAEETDVDTGQAVISRSVDLSVISAYLLPQTQNNSKARVPQPLSEPPQLFSNASSLKPLNKTALLQKSVCAPQANSKWNRGEHQSNSSEITKDCTEEGKQEFFI